MFGISLIFVFALVAPAACAIVFNGGTAQWNNGAATGNTIEITNPLTYTIAVNRVWASVIFDEAVTSDGSISTVNCDALQVSDCFIEMDS